MALRALDLSARVWPWAGASGASGSSGSPAITWRTGWAAVSLPTLVKLSVLVLLTGQLGRIPLIAAGAKEAPLLLNDLFLVAALVAGAMLALRRRRFLLDWTSSLALAFVLVGGLSALLAGPRFGLSAFQLGFSLAYLARWCAYFGLYLLVLNFFRSEDLPSLWKVLEGTVLLFAAFGILQSAFLPGFAQMVYPQAELYTQWDPQGHRLVSTFLDPNLAGALLVLILLVQVAQLALGSQVALWKPLLIFLALALTLSRSSALAFIAGLGVIVLFRGLSRRVLRGMGVAAVLSLPLVPLLLNLAVQYNKLDLTDPSLLARFVAWGRAVVVFLDHPVLGVGFNTYGFIQADYGFGGLVQSSFGLDGGLLFIAVMTGLLGVIIYSAMVLRVGMESHRILKDQARPPFSRGLALGVMAATVALLVHSIFLNSILYPFLMQVLWIFWGMVAVTYRNEVGPSRRTQLAFSKPTGR